MLAGTVVVVDDGVVIDVVDSAAFETDAVKKVDMFDAAAVVEDAAVSADDVAAVVTDVAAAVGVGADVAAAEERQNLD